MHRRRFLVASLPALAGLAGCTAGGYRASGPRTPPPAPETAARTSRPDPVESRAAAVVRPLNELYRVVRGPLGDLALDEVTDADLDAAGSALASARDALATFTSAVADPPPRYRSLPRLVTAHAALLDGLSAAVDLHAALSTLRSDAASPAARDRLAAAREARGAVGTAASSLRSVVDADPAVPAAMFLTLDRAGALAATLDTAAAAGSRLVDAAARVVAAAADWRRGVDAVERGAFETARSAVGSARVGYRDAAALLDRAPAAGGAVADLLDRWSCRARAGRDATATALDAIDAALAGDDARAERLLETAETTRNGCEN